MKQVKSRYIKDDEYYKRFNSYDLYDDENEDEDEYYGNEKSSVSSVLVGIGIIAGLLSSIIFDDATLGIVIGCIIGLFIGSFAEIVASAEKRKQKTKRRIYARNAQRGEPLTRKVFFSPSEIENSKVTATLGNNKKLGFGSTCLPICGDSTVNVSELKSMADYYIANSFNFFDISFINRILGGERAFKSAVIDRYKRDKLIIAEGACADLVKSRVDYEHLFDEQLKRTGAKYFDFYLLRELTDASFEHLENFGGLNFLENLKTSGRVRHIGFSACENPDLIEKILISHPSIDFVDIPINYFDFLCGSPSFKCCYDVVRKYNKPIIASAPTKGRLLSNIGENAKKLFRQVNPDASATSWALGYVASLDGVCMVVGEMSNLCQVEDSVSYMRDFSTLADTEQQTIKHAVELIKHDYYVNSTSPCNNKDINDSEN